MSLPPTFEFTQSNLQDYLECRRRFQLRYIMKVAWPAVMSEPLREQERHMLNGTQFHRMAQQYLLGILPEGYTPEGDEKIQDWWGNFMETIPGLLKGERHVEQALGAPYDGYRLVAKYDLVLIHEGKAAIFDWKTNSKRTNPRTLLNRIQTKLYPLALTRAGSSLNHGKSIAAGQIEMTYWFAEFPGQPERLAYNEALYKRDGQAISGLIDEIKGLSDEQFTKTDEERACKFCAYRSYCDRGVTAGSLDELEEDVDEEIEKEVEIDFDQIAEIEF